MQLGQSLRRRGTSRPIVRDDNSGSAQSWVHCRTVRPSKWFGTGYLCEGHVYQTKRKNKEANTSYDEPKRHIVLSGKRDIVGVEGKTDMSEDYEKFHEIPSFKVKADPSILINDEDYPWLRRNKERTQAKKKWRLCPQLLWWYHDNFQPFRSSFEMPIVTDKFPYEILILRKKLSV